jgi:hypothetical protein
MTKGFVVLKGFGSFILLSHTNPNFLCIILDVPNYIVPK